MLVQGLAHGPKSKHRDTGFIGHNLAIGLKSHGADAHVIEGSHVNRSNKDPFTTFNHSSRTLVTEDSICNPKEIYGATTH